MRSSLGYTTIMFLVNNIISQTTKSELAQYFHATLFSPTTTSLIKEINIGLLKDLAGPHRGVNKYSYGKIDKHNNGTPTHENTRTEINQKKTSIYIPRG